MHRKIVTLLGPGFVVGIVLCIVAVVVGRASGIDSVMAKHEVLGLASAPLSSFAGEFVYDTKTRMANQLVWAVLDYGQVIVNWLLLSLVLMGVVMIIRERRQRRI